MQATIEDEESVTARNNAKHTELIIVDGQNVDDDDYVLIDKNARRAHICCGCDTRNATFTVNIVSMCIYFFGIVSFSLIIGDKLNYDDDHVQGIMNSFEDAKIGIMIAICAVGIICNAIAIYGATYFNKYGVMIGAGWFMLEAVRSLFFLDIGNAIMSTCFFYPHIVFYFELKNGVMSKENYPKEKVCCDCCCSC